MILECICESQNARSQEVASYSAVFLEKGCCAQQTKGCESSSYTDVYRVASYEHPSGDRVSALLSLNGIVYYMTKILYIA